MKKKVFYVALMMGATLLTGCLGDDNKKNDPIDVTITEGVVVVNNGSCGQQRQFLQWYRWQYEFYRLAKRCHSAECVQDG